MRRPYIVLEHAEEYLCWKQEHPAMVLRWNANYAILAPSLESRNPKECFLTEDFDRFVKVSDAIGRMGQQFKEAEEDDDE